MFKEEWNWHLVNKGLSQGRRNILFYVGPDDESLGRDLGENFLDRLLKGIYNKFSKIY